MKIRDMHSTISGDTTEYEMPSGGLEIIAEDGRTLFCIHGIDGKIEISTGRFCKHKGKVLDTGIIVKPKASNLIEVSRVEYK